MFNLVMKKLKPFTRILGQKQKPESRVVSVRVDFYKDGGYHHSRDINIPNGSTFRNRFANHPKLVGPDGRIVREFIWQPGYGVEYVYIYDSDQGDQWDE